MRPSLPALPSTGRSDLEDYDHRLIPNALERRWSPDLDLGLKLQKQYAQIEELLEQAGEEGKRVPANYQGENIQRTEDEQQGLRSLQAVEEQLQRDELAVFERGPVGTVEYLNALAEGWNSKYLDLFGFGPEYEASGISGYRYGRSRRAFSPNPAGHRQIGERLADALATAQALDSAEGRQAMEVLLEQLQAVTDRCAAVRSVLSTPRLRFTARRSARAAMPSIPRSHRRPAARRWPVAGSCDESG